MALLPFLHASVLVSLVDGSLSATSISDYANAVNDALQVLVSKGEISGKKVFIDPKQRILENDTLKIEYGIVPKGKTSMIVVEQSIKTNTK